MKRDEIDRILSKEFKWKIYWNKPLVLFFLLSGSAMLLLFFYYWVIDSETLWGFFLIVGIGFYFCGIVLLNYYLLQGPFIAMIESTGLRTSPQSHAESPRMGPRMWYTNIYMNLDLMKQMRPYLIDRYMKPVVNKETDRWIILEFKNENKYKYDKRLRVLWIYRGKRTREILDLEYYDVFNELKSWKRK